MKDGRAYALLRRFVDVRPEEAPAVLRFFLQFFLIMAAAYMIMPLKISSFLKELGYEKLPWVFLLTAILMSFVAAFNSRLMQRMGRRRYAMSSQVFYILSLLVFRILFLKHQKWVTVAFWFWSDVFLATSVSQFWIRAGDYFSPRQARRFVGFFIGGGLLGGITGSLAASLHKGILLADDLLLMCALFLLISLWLAVRAPRSADADMGPADAPESPPGAKVRVGYLQSLKALLSSRYLLLLSGMMLTAVMVSNVINFQFSAVLKLHFKGDNDRITVFVAAFNTVLLVVSYLFNAFSTNRILRRFGLRNAISVAPAVLALGAGAGFLSIVAGPFLLGWATVMRGADKGLTHSLSQSTRELLYIPVPPETKHKAKTFIDLFVSKLGDALAALFLLVYAILLKIPVKQLSWLTLAFILAWLLFNRRLIREYVGIVKKNLALKWPDADKLVFDQIDVDATKLVFDTLESRNRSSVLYAMNLLDLIKKEKLSPELKKILSLHSDAVWASSFDGLLDARAETSAPVWDDLLEDADLDAQVQDILSLDVYQQVMRERVEKIAEARGGEDVTAQMEVAKALGMMSADAPLVRNLGRLLKHESVEVVRYALESAGRQRKMDFVPLIVPHLGRAATREVAEQALLAYGDRIAGTLKDYLADPDEPAAVRGAIPEILSRMGTERAADALVRELRKGDDSVRAAVIEALGRLRSRLPSIAFRAADIEPEIFANIRRSCEAVIGMNVSRLRGAGAAAAEGEEKVLVRTLKLVFVLLGLLYPQDDIARAYQNYTEGTRRSVDYSLELLEHLLRKEIKDALMPLLEERPLDEKAAACAKVIRSM
jgi:AAA family ATP:ADP antiporter